MQPVKPSHFHCTNKICTFDVLIKILQSFFYTVTNNQLPVSKTHFPLQEEPFKTTLGPLINNGLLYLLILSQRITVGRIDQFGNILGEKGTENQFFRYNDFT